MRRSVSIGLALLALAFVSSLLIQMRVRADVARRIEAEWASPEVQQAQALSAEAELLARRLLVIRHDLSSAEQSLAEAELMLGTLESDKRRARATGSLIDPEVLAQESSIRETVSQLDSSRRQSLEDIAELSSRLAVMGAEDDGLVIANFFTRAYDLARTNQLERARLAGAIGASATFWSGVDHQGSSFAILRIDETSEEHRERNNEAIVAATFFANDAELGAPTPLAQALGYNVSAWEKEAREARTRLRSGG